MANATCGPMYVLDTTGTIQNCGVTYLIGSVAFENQNNATSIAQLEDGFNRVIYYCKTACSSFRSYHEFPIPANGLVLRTLTSGTTLYVQVVS